MFMLDKKICHLAVFEMSHSKVELSKILNSYTSLAAKRALTHLCNVAMSAESKMAARGPKWPKES